MAQGLEVRAVGPGQSVAFQQPVPGAEEDRPAFGQDEEAVAVSQGHVQVVKNAGYAVGLAAAAAFQSGRPVRDIDLSLLQSRLRELGVLPAWAFDAFAIAEAEAGRGGLTNPHVTDQLDTPISALSAGGLEALTALLAFSPGETIPRLEARYAELTGTRDVTGVSAFDDEISLLSMALAWYGSTAGSDRFTSLLELALREGRHRTPPHRRSSRTSIIRDGNGDDYSLVNRLLVFAGRSPGESMIPAMAILVRETPGLGESISLAMPYDACRGDIVSSPFYYRLRNIALAAERKAHPSLIPPMERLLGCAGVAGHSVAVGAHDSPRYMAAHPEISLARAAARCGSIPGAQLLTHYLKDTHVFFRRHAAEELRIATGRSFASPEDWSSWLAQNPNWPASPLAITRGKIEQVSPRTRVVDH